MIADKLEVLSEREPQRQIVSKERVQEFGEVYTDAREVNAMLDLVKQETERIEATFLEPACGDGNFLAEVLERKLAVIDRRYAKSQLEYERNAIVAMGSLYGIDIIKSNVEACRKRLLSIFEGRYQKRFGKRTREDCVKVAKFILERNLVWGNALTLETEGPNPEPIVFSEWKPVNGSQIKRRDYSFSELTPNRAEEQPVNFGPRQSSLFGEEQDSLFRTPKDELISDTGVAAFIPEVLENYPVVHFLRLADVDQ